MNDFKTGRNILSEHGAFIHRASEGMEIRLVQRDTEENDAGVRFENWKELCQRATSGLHPV